MAIEVVATGPSDASSTRAPGSVRRTTTIDMTWSDGFGSTLTLDGRGRDLVTPEAGEPRTVADERLRITVRPDNVLAGIEAEPVRPELAALVGTRSGSGFRTRMAELLPAGRDDGSPTNLMLDDTPGATLISGFAFSRWQRMEDLIPVGSPLRARNMTGICTGFAPGSSSLAPDGTSRWTHRTRSIAPLDSSEDPWAWHPIRSVTEVSMRRARRIDVRRDGEVLVVDAMFQDSATTPDGGRDAVHEYTLSATIDVATSTLSEIEAVPRVLPYVECPLASLNLGAVVGTPVEQLRSVVLERLAGVAGCTHLNDAVRALADVPHLITLLDLNQGAQS